MEVIEMTRMIKTLSIAGLSSVYLMQGTCSLSGDGLSILPTFPSVSALLASFGIVIPGI
jgi:hypothetical protein